MIALITGANRGIGLELARLMAQRGDVVIGTSRQASEATDLVAMGVTVLPLDVLDPSSIDSLGAAMAGRPIDVLVNNAGVSSESKTLASCTAAELARVLATNATGPVLVAKALMPSLEAGSRRLIVNVSSQLGSIRNNTGGSSYGYRASKAALNMLTQKLSDELAAELPGSCTVALHPGWVQTDMGGPQAPLTVQQAAATIIKTIDGLKPEQTGAYLNTDGTGLPW